MRRRPKGSGSNNKGDDNNNDDEEMNIEPDYQPVPGEPHDPEDGDVPSSFYGNKKPYRSLFPRSYNFRRRAPVVGVLCVFMVAGILASFALGHRRGHINKGGAGSFLGNTATPDPAIAANAKKGMVSMVAAGRRLAVTTWNIAAINNNPFEYWITYKGDPQYEKLMVDVQNFLENPGDKDVPVHQVFTESMFTELDTTLTSVAGWKSVKNYWDEEYKNRKIVSDFLKDEMLGAKRLASMPDRVTNTINVVGSEDPVCRPTVINQYSGDLSTMDKWWAEWQRFMFKAQVKIRTKTGVEEKIPYQMLKKILNSKYESITLQEEEDSLPLQTLCAAIFDAILVHMMNNVSPPEVWQGIRTTLVENLIKKKVPHTLQILESTYMDADIITLQEVASSFVATAKASTLGEHFHIVSPESMDSARDQNSIVMLKKTTFPGGPLSEISGAVEKSFPEGEKVPVDKGDILAITTTNADGVPFVVASFHGDTNGKATKPVLDALMKTMTMDSQLISHRLIFGLDANVYERPTPKVQSVADWGKHYQKYGLTSCWGDTVNPKNYTTYNARTYLQPQLNKACKKEEQREKGDVNPKDFILFRKEDFNVVHTWKDNTGEKTYTEDSAFPTLTFPSDHGLLSTVLEPKEPTQRKP